MLSSKCKYHLLAGSGEEKRLLPYMGMTAILVTWPEPFEQRGVRMAERLALPTFGSRGRGFESR